RRLTPRYTRVSSCGGEKMRIAIGVCIGIVICWTGCSFDAPPPRDEAPHAASEAITGYAITLAAERNPTFCGDWETLTAAVTYSDTPVSRPYGLYFGQNGRTPNPTTDGDGLPVVDGQAHTMVAIFTGNNFWRAWFVTSVVPLEMIFADLTIV